MKTSVEVLESMSSMDDCLDHDVEVCGHCMTRRIMAECAREILVEPPSDSLHVWDKAWRERWDDTKFMRLYNEEVQAGRDPKQAFDAKGWEM